MHRKFLAMTIAAAALALPSFAQDSKLNGSWKLDASKSTFGQFPPPTSETDTLTVKGNDFKQQFITVNARGTQNGLRSCTVDGAEVALSPDDPRVQMGAIKLTKMQCSWDGKSVVFLETVNLNGGVLTDKLTFSPSDDGQTMTMTSHISSATMNGDRKLVYEKDDGSSTPSPATGAAMMTPTPGAAAMIHAGGAAPSLSGTWKLNISKSIFGQLPPPASQVDTIDDSEPSVKVAEDQKGGMMGDMNVTSTFDTTGKETKSAGMGGADVTSTAHWDGVALVVDSKTSFQGNDVKIKDTYTLSGDGKTLTEVTHIESGMGNFDTTSVFDKQ
jgi:VCBS repeat-containing protein